MLFIWMATTKTILIIAWLSLTNYLAALNYSQQYDNHAFCNLTIIMKIDHCANVDK